MLALMAAILAAIAALLLLGGGTAESTLRHKGRVPFLFQVLEVSRVRVLIVSYRPNRFYYKVGVTR